MRNFIFIIFFLFLCSCFHKSTTFIDLDAPEFCGVFYSPDDRLIFQFNEPLQELTLITPEEETFYFKNRFPVANIYMESKTFESYQTAERIKSKLKLTATDTSGNSSMQETPIPYLNRYPATLFLSRLQLRYSYKISQRIELYCDSAGATFGFALHIFVRSKFFVIELPSIELKQGEILYFFLKTADLEKPVLQKLNRKNCYEIRWNKHMLQTAGAMILTLHTGETMDAFAYYDGNKHSLEEYRTTPYHKKLFTEVNSREIIMSDIQGHTIKKCISRKRNNENNFVVTID